jgi:hypothetical protein
MAAGVTDRLSSMRELLESVSRMSTRTADDSPAAWTGSKLLLVIALLILALGLASHVQCTEAPTSMKQFNVICPALVLLPVLDCAYHECNNGFDGSCEKFVATLRKLLPEYDCQRPFDATPTQNFIVPAIWLAGDGLSTITSAFWPTSPSRRARAFRDCIRRKPLMPLNDCLAAKSFNKLSMASLLRSICRSPSRWGGDLSRETRRRVAE